MPYHQKRRWFIRPVTEGLRSSLPDAPSGITLAELFARYLVECAAPPCAAFCFGKYLFLNDSASADGAQEYAIIDNTTLEQIDSVTFSWMTVPGAFEFILNLLDGNYDALPTFGKVESRQLQQPKQRDKCQSCQ